MAAPWGTTRFAYDGNGLLDKVIDPVGGVFNLGYDPLGRLASLARPSGVSDAYVYDAAGQVAAHLARGAVDPRYLVAEMVTYILLL